MARRALLSTRAVAAVDAIDRVARGDLSAQQVVEGVLQRIARVIDADVFFVGATDPDTGLNLGAMVSFNFPLEACAPFWENEFRVPDFNKFADLTADNPVGDLRQATGGKLSRSARYRTLNAIAGFEDELRATLPAGGRSWGNLQVNRLTGGRPFSDGDREFLRAIAPVAGSALRRTLLEEPAHTDPSRGPGMIVVDQVGTVINISAEAEAWLAELSASWWPNVRIHPELLQMALGTMTEPGAAPRRMRLRTRCGTWLIAHASPLVGSGHVGIVIEPAKASEVAPIVVEAYGLTGREVEVTRLVARGLSTDEIASTLFLSRHTVRDHVKAIFEKVGVSSRGELTSKLFAEHYHPALESANNASLDRVKASVEAAREAV